jgi:hypothetical protein
MTPQALRKILGQITAWTENNGSNVSLFLENGIRLTRTINSYADQECVAIRRDCSQLQVARARGRMATSIASVMFKS